MGPTSRRLLEDVTCKRAPCEASAAIGGMPGALVGAGYPLARGLEHKALTVRHDLIFLTVAHRQEKAPGSHRDRHNGRAWQPAAPQPRRGLA